MVHIIEAALNGLVLLLGPLIAIVLVISLLALLQRLSDLWHRKPTQADSSWACARTSWVWRPSARKTVGSHSSSGKATP